MIDCNINQEWAYRTKNGEPVPEVPGGPQANKHRNLAIAHDAMLTGIAISPGEEFTELNCNVNCNVGTVPSSLSLNFLSFPFLTRVQYLIDPVFSVDFTIIVHFEECIQP